MAAPTASEQDKSFVAKVSQGGMYEVELGKVAETAGPDPGHQGPGKHGSP